MFRIICIAAGLVALAAGAATAKDEITPDDVSGPITWGSATRVTQLRNLYFADQPDAAGLEAAKQAGVTMVISLRGPDEIDWNEPAAVEALGLSYHNVPVTGPRFDPEAIARIDALVSGHPDDQILIHCGSSNRVGGWLATHLVTQHGLSEEEALAVGRRAGITNQGIVTRVHAYVETRDE